MKVGIMTFFRANNYGAILQAFALQKKIEEITGSCECIDYRCDAIERAHGFRRIVLRAGLMSNIKNVIRSVVLLPRMAAFASFRKKIPHSVPYTSTTIVRANEEYDAFVAGSDQVFNLKLTGGDVSFFLDFVSNNKKKVAYAASMGEFLIEQRQLYRRLLSDFEWISVRENSTSNTLQTEIDIDVSVAPDPVFLHTKEEWLTLLEIRKKKEKIPYVLIYSLFGDDSLFETARRIAKQKGWKVVLIARKPPRGQKIDKVYKYLTPKRFVEMIANAEYVVTDSFHGTSFAIIFQKQFYVVLPSKAPNRILDLLEKMQLEDRVVDDMVVNSKEIRYDLVKGRCVDYREEGLCFLKRLIY